MVNKIMNGESPVESRGSSIGADFPKHSLKASLRVASALEEKNGGNPMPPTDVAIALEKSPGSSDFRVLLSSSIKYGLTVGSYNQPKVSVTGLARDILEPTSDEAKGRALFQAAFTPDLFRKIFEAYKNKKVPDPTFFQNALVRDFGVARDQAGRCAALFLENVEYLGLVKQATTGKWLGGEQTGWTQQQEPQETEETPEVEPSVSGHRVQTVPVATTEKATRAPSAKNAIFLGHGKNRVPLQQLEKLLTEYKIPHKIAVDEANKGRPISEKVADLMKECGAAIIIFTADEEFKDANGKVIFRPSENAIFELGAASALYGSRVIIFKER